MSIRPVSLLLPVVLLLGCGAGCGADGARTPAELPDSASAPAPAAPAPVAGEVELGVGETGTVAGLDLTLVGVSGDSRCPAGVSCVWQGDAVATVRARAEGTDETFELHLTVEPRSTVVEGRRVTFRALAPAAVEGRTIPADAYRATFGVEPV